MQDSFHTNNDLAILSKTDTLDVELKGVKVDCNGHFDVKKGKILHVKGNIEAEVTEQIHPLLIRF
jgi:hypothetical protein